MDIFLQILGLAYIVFAFINLRMAVLLLPFFFPAYLLKFDVAGVPFPLVEVFIYGTFFAGLIHVGWEVVKHKVSLKKTLEPFSQSWWLPVLGIVVAGAISIFMAPQQVTMLDGNTIFYGRKVAMGIFKSWIVAPVLMLGLFTWVVKTRKDIEITLNSYVVSSAFLASWGIYQVLTGNYSTPDLRASGPFNSANYLALFITPALFYSLIRVKDFLVVEQVSWWKKVFYVLTKHYKEQRPQFFVVLVWFLASALLLFGLLFTKSYAAFLSLIVAGCLWAFVQFRMAQRVPWKMLGILAFILAIILAALIALDPTKWELFFQFTTRTSSGVRVEIYKIATSLILQHPILGIGLGMFPAMYQLEGPRILGHLPYELNMLHPHDVFLAFWLNLGLLGFVSFLWILSVCFKNGWKQFKQMAHLQKLSIEWFHGVGLLMLVVILVHGLVDTPFFKNDLALLFWLVFVVITLPATHRNDRT